MTTDDMNPPRPNGGSPHRIIEAAWRVIAERGLQGLTTRLVAREAGLSHSMVHYHYSTKDDLLVAVVRHIRRYWITPLEEYLASDAPIQERLGRVIAWMAEPATREVVRVHLSLLTQAQADSRLREEMRREYARWQDGYVRLFTELRDAGLLRQGVTPAHAGRAFAAAADALVQEQSLDPQMDTAALMWALVAPMMVCSPHSVAGA